jgi:hypothetical protein
VARHPLTAGWKSRLQDRKCGLDRRFASPDRALLACCTNPCSVPPSRNCSDPARSSATMAIRIIHIDAVQATRRRGEPGEGRGGLISNARSGAIESRSPPGFATSPLSCAPAISSAMRRSSRSTTRRRSGPAYRKWPEVCPSSGHTGSQIRLAGPPYRAPPAASAMSRSRHSATRRRSSYARRRPRKTSVRNSDTRSNTASVVDD